MVQLGQPVYYDYLLGLKQIVERKSERGGNITDHNLDWVGEALHAVLSREIVELLARQGHRGADVECTA